ncbi:MAG: type II toxin-antitoxin system VapC family toxin, partial [Candidatus Dormibacteraceae bacterium]
AAEAIGRFELNAPELLDVEILHALRGKVEIRREISAEAGELALQRLGQLPIHRHRHSLLLSRVWELRHNVTAYDAIYVALAEKLELHLVTGDLRLAKASGPRCEFCLIEDEDQGAND